VAPLFWSTLYIQTLDNAHNSQVQGLSLGDKRSVDINDEQTDGILDEIWMIWNSWEIWWIAVTCSKQMVRSVCDCLALCALVDNVWGSSRGCVLSCDHLFLQITDDRRGVQRGIDVLNVQNSNNKRNKRVYYEKIANVSIGGSRIF